ncbi:response regulator [Cohnella thailandensis]|uniref:Response regulator n=1 Tax=Cohnella thailandensis TaxID=557557 RepID=A0A841T584_9BACL|nr:response regulator [Cohnella thailandensis]MBB6637250.1 response regulator [Cohnella thailandensis]MBP1976925.1 two-component system response regulator YesN [Cohnella thailandensis]
MLVLIVDDELEIREGLRANFPWEDYGIEEAITADDGDTGLAAALKRRPDLIVTDIRMKRMSGLELIEKLSAERPEDWKSIVVSGYDDYEIVRQAMRLGAMDYILKPINTAELGEIVRRMVDQLEKERMDREHRQLLSRQVESALPKMRDELLRELLEIPYNPYRETRIRHRLTTLQLDWVLKKKLAVLAIEVDDMKAIENREGSRREKELILYGIGNVVKQTLEEDCSLRSALYPDSKNRWIVVAECRDSGQLEEHRELGALCIRRINQFVKVNVSAAVCSAPDYASGLHAMYSETEDILEQKAVYGGNRLLTSLGWESATEKQNPSIRQPEEVLDLIRYGTDEDIRAAMDRFVEMVQSWGMAHIRDIQQGIFEWLLDLFKKAAAIGWTERGWERNPMLVWESLEQFDTMESLRDRSEKYLLDMAGDFRKHAASPSQITQEADRYIRKHYAECLTLPSVAAEVHVTPVWLSKLFKKEMRKTFLEHLTDIRMEHAKKMLADVRYKIYEVSSGVGYKDPVHFTKLFKKQLGLTPKEYRKLQGISDE